MFFPQCVKPSISMCIPLVCIFNCPGTFSFKGSNMLFFSFVCCFSRILYSLSVPGKQEGAELHTVLKTEIMREGTCLDSFQWPPSVTLLKCNLFSYVPLTEDIECFLALWNLLFAWLCFCSIFFFYCLKLPCMKIYKQVFLQIKHACFTRDLGPLRYPSHRLQSPGPGLQRPWQLTTEANESQTLILQRLIVYYNGQRILRLK